jgi:AcrR family transcriptional regulator
MPTISPSRTQPAPPELQAKAQPRQKRAVETYEQILGVTAQLLAEVGIERLSTNLVCERAGISPPALYRYFPNKYALLRELGMRLMAAQNTIVQAWATPATMKLPQAAFSASIFELYAQTLALTRELPEGLWVTRALRAVPALTQVRIDSHVYVSGLIQSAFLAVYPHAEVGRVAVMTRLAVEMVYAALEMMFDDPTLNEQAVGQTLADMITWQAMLLRKPGKSGG